MKKAIFTSCIVLIMFLLVAGMAFAEGKKGMGEPPAMKGAVAQMMGQTVVDDHGVQVGTVEEVVTGSDGWPAYVLISEKPGEKLIPIPYSQAQMKGDQVVLSGIDRQKLDNAPRISWSELNKLHENKFKQKIYSYYGEETTPGGGALHGTPGEETLQKTPVSTTPRETPGGGGPVPRQ